MAKRRSSTQQDYRRLKLAVENAGFFADYQPIHVPGDRICFASEQFENGLTGVLLWVATRRGEWFIATYLPHIYRVPRASTLPELVISVLKAGGGTPYDFKAAVKEKFCLEEVTPEDFDKL